MLLSGSRASKIAFLALCVLAPAVFAVKSVLKPGGDLYPLPSKTPAVPILLVTVDGVDARELAVPRAEHPMPALAAWVRDGASFATGLPGSDDPASARAALLTGALARDHGVTGLTSRLPEDRKTLAGELRAIGYKTLAVPSRPEYESCGLGLGFDSVRIAPSPAAAVEELDRFLGDAAPPRFFAWLDLCPSSRDPQIGRRELDGALAALELLLERRRIQGDGFWMLATLPPRREAAGAALRPRVPRSAIALRYPYERRSGSVLPGSASAIDLAPTALQLVRATPPPAWRGRSRILDTEQVASIAGPAIAGPFLSFTKALWAAEQGSALLLIDGAGDVAEFTDPSDPNARRPPEQLLAAARAAASGVREVR